MRRRGLWVACVVLLVGVVGVLAVGTGFANDEGDKDEDDGAKCSEATLHGTYLVAHNGVVIEETKKGPPQGPFAQAGYEVYDGNGKKIKSHMYTYDSRGLKTERKTLDAGGNVIAVRKYIYQ